MKDQRNTITEELNAYYEVYSEENQEKARRAVQLAEERRMKEEPREYKRGGYVECIHFYKKCDDFSEPAFIAFAVHPDDLNEAVAAAKKEWPDAIVSGVVEDFIESGSAVKIVFNQMHKDND